MMNSNLRLCSAIALCWVMLLQAAWGQACQPDPTYINSEFIVNPPPDSIGESCSLNQGVLNEPYEQTFTIVVQDSIAVDLGGAPIAFDVISFTIDDIVGLPSGVTYTCEPPDCVFTSNTVGCIILSGTPTQTGVYSLIIQATMEANIGVDLTLPIEIPNQAGAPIFFPPLGEREYVINVYPDSSTPQNCFTGGGVAGCTNACATNYDAAANIDDGSCTLPSADDGCDLTTDSIDPATCAIINTPPNPDDGCPNTDDSFDATTCEILNTSNCPTDTELDATMCTCVPVMVAGCTNPDACNYDPMAVVEDGSCIIQGGPCDDGNPLTDNDTIQADCSCKGIDNGQGVPTLGEWGLIILALLLLNIAVLGIRQTEMRIENA